MEDGYQMEVLSGRRTRDEVKAACTPTPARSPAATSARGVTRVAPLAPPWSEADAADINSWGHPDRTYEPLLLVRCCNAIRPWRCDCENRRGALR